MQTPTARLLPLILAVCSLALLALPGCGHSPPKEYIPETDPKAPPPPTMQGYGEFFGGKLLAEASLGRGFRMRPGKMRELANRLGREDGDPFSDTYYLDDEPDAQYFIPRMSNSSLPPVALRLRVTNQLKEPVEVEFIECNSLLGNFAVRPEKITIAPGETGSPDPMTSLLGLSDGEFQLQVGLKVAGVSETKILVMRVIKNAKEAKVDKEGNLLPDKDAGRPRPPKKK